MPRLSDRAFHIVKTEIERRYTDDPTDQIERVILLARLEALRARKGTPMTRVQIWEVLSDVAPNFDQNVLMDAESVETDSPILGASIGVGAVAVLVATAIGMDSLAPVPSAEQLNAEPSQISDEMPSAAEKTPDKNAAVNQGLKQNARDVSSTAITGHESNAQQNNAEQNNAEQNNAEQNNAERGDKSGAAEPQDEDSEHRSYKNRFLAILNMGSGKLRANALAELEAAKSLGWQAALKSQDPPHSAQHWRETAEFWERAIAHLDQIPSSSRDYSQVQTKKNEYQYNLSEVRARQAEAEQTLAQSVSAGATELATPTAETTPNFSNLANSAQNASSESSQAKTQETERASELIKAAREYGWQAAVASQNAPHPPEKWADISRLWQTALSTLNQVAPSDPRYAEAQQVKVLYQDNLSAIRDRYQREQTATQRLQSLQASLSELNNSLTSDTVKYGQMEAILERLKTIPAGTEAHVQAQLLIADTMADMNAIAVVPSR